MGSSEVVAARCEELADFYDGAMEDTAQAMTFITRASAIWEARGDASARAGGGALPVIMSIIRSSAKPTTTATITCARYKLIKNNNNNNNKCRPPHAMLWQTRQSLHVRFRPRWRSNVVLGVHRNRGGRAPGGRQRQRQCGCRVALPARQLGIRTMTLSCIFRRFSLRSRPPTLPPPLRECDGLHLVTHTGQCVEPCSRVDRRVVEIGMVYITVISKSGPVLSALHSSENVF